MSLDGDARRLWIQDRLSELSVERRALLAELSAAEKAAGQTKVEPVVDDAPKDAARKIELFRRRFVARSDVFSVYWENPEMGTKGYYPACEAVYEGGVRLRPTELYARYGSARFQRLDEGVLADHLMGRKTIGSYAIRPDDTCIFLAADFDGAGWREAAASYVDAAAVLGFQLLVEVSRSGEGAHAWLFFAEPVSARLARSLGGIFLSEASVRLSCLELAAYDRFFPNQDTMPKGGFGNLIGLPLQKKLRELGRTVFVDESFAAFPDQWQALARTPAYWEHHARVAVESYAGILSFENVEPEVLSEHCLSIAALREGVGLNRLPDWKAELRSSITISTVGLPDEFVAKLMRLATIPNPEFFVKQRMRFPVFNIPRCISSFERSEGAIALPRGVLESVSELFEKRGARLEIVDLRLSEKRIQIRFTGRLTPSQKEAVGACEGRENGVLVAPPGSGKTVMACSLICRWKLATVVLVSRSSIAKQWRARLKEFTSLQDDRIGSLGGGKSKLTGVVDIVMLQSLARLEDAAAFFSGYSAVVVDECHHVPAVTFEAILRECGSRKIVGLTATPKRKDGLEKLLYQQCGPVRHLVAEEADPELRKLVLFVETAFGLNSGEQGAGSLNETWEAMIGDGVRNAQIVSVLADQLREGRKCIVLSDRLNHLEILKKRIQAERLDERTVFETMIGGRSERAAAAQEGRLRLAAEAGSPICIFSTGSFLGEGYDLKELDTLLLCMPISFKGRIVQYAGRLQRRCLGKKEIRVFDFLDRRLSLAMAMWRRRKGAYREMGYLDASREPEDGIGL